MRVSLATLGCKANQYDTEAVAELFRRAGYEVVPSGAPAEVCLVNSCSVTEEAVRKTRQLLRRACRANPGAAVVLTGCYAQIGGKETLGLPGVALVVGPQDRGRLVELVEEHLANGRPRRVVRPPGAEKLFVDLPVMAFTERTRAWLKIQDGCEQFCAYCQIPLARGPVRSLPLPRVLAEARRLAAAGYQELVLTGIHLGAYGQDLPDHPTLARAVEALERTTGLRRLRLGSVEPDDVTSELIEAWAGSPVSCPHLHLPLQSGDDATLARMRRPYRTRDYAGLLDRLRWAIPAVAISTDLMVGFPGETEQDFDSSLAFAVKMGFSRLHVFPFSARPGTSAALLPQQLPRAAREERSRAAVAFGEELALCFNRSLLGQEVEILVEEWRDDRAAGLAGQYVQVEFASARDPRNEIVAVAVTEASSSRLTGIRR